MSWWMRALRKTKQSLITNKIWASTFISVHMQRQMIICWYTSADGLFSTVNSTLGKAVTGLFWNNSLLLPVMKNINSSFHLTLSIDAAWHQNGLKSFKRKVKINVLKKLAQEMDLSSTHEITSCQPIVSVLSMLKNKCEGFVVRQ